MDFKQFMREVKTVLVYHKINTLDVVFKLLEDLKENTHEDDDDTHDCYDRAISALEDLKFYTGDGHRI